jgi:hypothetical protein
MDNQTKVEFLNDIPSAKVVRQETEENEVYKKEIAKYIGYTNDSIQSAKDRGLTHTTFCSQGKYEDELKRLYKEKGYWFKPTGYYGGVRQDSEEICW